MRDFQMVVGLLAHNGAEMVEADARSDLMSPNRDEYQWYRALITRLLLNLRTLPMSLILIEPGPVRGQGVGSGDGAGWGRPPAIRNLVIGRLPPRQIREHRHVRPPLLRPRRAAHPRAVRIRLNRAERPGQSW